MKTEPKPAPGGISKERLENLLDAVNKEEKKVQDKVNAKKVKGNQLKPRKIGNSIRQFDEKMYCSMLCFDLQFTQRSSSV
jgi:superfamily I DNA and/or RNA helicase